MNARQTLTHPATSLADARARRGARRRLRADFDTYRTPAERAELTAILSRLGSEEIARLERLAGRTAA